MLSVKLGESAVVTADGPKSWMEKTLRLMMDIFEIIVKLKFLGTTLDYLNALCTVLFVCPGLTLSSTPCSRSRPLFTEALRALLQKSLNAFRRTEPEMCSCCQDQRCCQRHKVNL